MNNQEPFLGAVDCPHVQYMWRSVEARELGPQFLFANAGALDDVLDLLRAAVKREGSQTGFAKHHSLNRSHLNMVLRGKRPMGHAVADALGLRIVYIAK